MTPLPDNADKATTASRLERDIAYLRANRHVMSWKEKLAFPFVIWFARKMEPYRLARLAREGREDPYDRQPTPGVYEATHRRAAGMGEG